MDDNEALGSLSAEEQAYFDTRGEAPAEPEKKPAEIEVDPEVEAELEEVDGAAQAEIEGKQEPKKLVPLAALTKERAGSKELKAKLAELEKNNAVLMDRWNMVLASNEKPQEQAKDDDPEPDPNTDIFAHNAWLKRQVTALKAETTEEKQRKEQEAAATEHENKVWNYWHQSAAEYKTANPEFDDVVKWMSETRTTQLKALSKLHPQFQTEAGIVKQINAELKDIVVAAAQNNISPAEYIHEMAKQWGYSGPKPAENADPVANLEKVEQAIDASTSMSSVGGSRPQTALDATAVANMSPSEFESWLAKNGAAKFRKLAGG